MTAWLAYTAKRSKRVSVGYDDAAATHYSWDSTVPNHGTVKAKDQIVVWDGEFLIGASVIEAIEIGSMTKKTPFCPTCKLANVAPRKTMLPVYKCWDCAATFDEPGWKTKKVTTYRSLHEAGWVNLSGVLTGTELRALCVKPKSQNALRELRWDDFQGALADTGKAAPLTVLESALEVLVGGHRKVTVRARVGQMSFRRELLDRFGAVCAFSGPAPAQALEAAHLYSYAAAGKHHPNGGLLLRRDLHSLFDLGLIAVHPDTLVLDMAGVLLEFDEYAKLHGEPLAVPVTAQHRKWLVEHWATHRPVSVVLPAQAQPSVTPAAG